MLFKKAVHVQRESLFSVSMPEAHSGTGCPEHSRLPVYFMTKYEYLLSKNENGELNMLQREFGLAPHLSGWMEYYAFHLAHPEMSHLELANNLNVGHSTVQRALAFMQQELL